MTKTKRKPCWRAFNAEVTHHIKQLPPTFVPSFRGRALAGVHTWLEAHVWQKDPKFSHKTIKPQQNVYAQWEERAASVVQKRTSSARHIQAPWFGRGNGLAVDCQLTAFTEIATGLRPPVLKGTIFKKNYSVWAGAPPQQKQSFCHSLKACTGIALDPDTLHCVHPLAASALSFLFSRFGEPLAAQLAVHTVGLEVVTHIDQVWRDTKTQDVVLLELKKTQSPWDRATAKTPTMKGQDFCGWADLPMNRYLIQAAVSHWLFTQTYTTSANLRSGVLCVGTYGVVYKEVPASMIEQAGRALRGLARPVVPPVTRATEGEEAESHEPPAKKAKTSAGADEESAKKE